MHSIPFVKAYTNVLTRPVKLRLCLFIFLFHKIYFTVYKSLIMVVENFQKYHWIQHIITQPVVIMTKRNKLLQMSGASEFFLIGTFNLHVYESLIIVAENFPKYHWIQHKQTQPVVALSELFYQT